MSPRVQRIRQAFVASASLRPMAQQLLQERTPQAYAGVTAYAQRHSKEDAGALAWLAIGYAHILDHDYAKAIDPLNHARPRAGDLGDYVAYYLGSSYLQTGRTAEAVATLADFSQKYPDSLLTKDAHVVYAGALLADNRAAEAAALLEKDRVPARADVELGLGRAYAAMGQTAKAVAALRNVYYRMPTSPEADTASTELKKLRARFLRFCWPNAAPAPTCLPRAKRYSDAATEYRDLLDEVSADERPGLQLALALALQKSGRSKDAKQVLNSTPDSTPEIAAQKLYLLGEVARAANEDDEFLRLQAQLRQSAPPVSGWNNRCWLRGTSTCLRRDYDKRDRCLPGNAAALSEWRARLLRALESRVAEPAPGAQRRSQAGVRSADRALSEFR